MSESIWLNIISLFSAFIGAMVVASHIRSRIKTSRNQIEHAEDQVSDLEEYEREDEEHDLFPNAS